MFIWNNLAGDIKKAIEPIENQLSEDAKNILWYNLPNKLKLLYSEILAIKPNCPESPNFIWYDLPRKVEAITDLINCEILEPNFYLRISGTDMYDNYGIEDEATFVSYLAGQDANNIVVTDFYLSADTLRCNLSFDGIISINLEYFGITKIVNLDALVNLNTLDFNDNQLTTIENLDALVNLNTLYLSSNQLTKIVNLDALVNLNTLGLGNNQLTTSEFNKLNSWAILAPNNGTIYASENTDNFNLSTSYTTLLAKGWIIYT